jgi:hypothetical protein
VIGTTTTEIIGAPFVISRKSLVLFTGTKVIGHESTKRTFALNADAWDVAIRLRSGRRDLL